MSLDIDLIKVQPVVVYTTNITHNLNKMAEALEIYDVLWRPKEGTRAISLCRPLEKAIDRMQKNPEYYRTFDAANRWGTYDDFLRFLEELLSECQEHPDARVEVSR